MKMKKRDDAHYWDLVKEIDESGDNLTHWEVEFIAWLIDNEETLRANGRQLSDPQRIKIEQIYGRRVSR